MAAWELFKQAALLPLGVLVPLAVVWSRGEAAASVASTIQILSALVAVSAGVAFLVCWKMGGRSAPGWLGVGLIDLGLLSVAYHSLSKLTLRGLVVNEPLGRVVVAIAVVAVLFAAIRTPEVDAGFRPARALTASTLAGLGVILFLDRLTSGRPSVESSASLAAASAAFCAALWLVLAAYVRFARSVPRPLRDWLTMFAVVRSAASVIGVAFPGGGWADAWSQLAMLLAATITLVAAAAALRWRVHGQDRYVYDLRTVLDRLRTDVESERAELDERLHDLRNAVAAMRTADSTLRRFEGRLDETTRVSLADALSTELSRLQSLIEPGRRPCIQNFELAAALYPVVATERALGSTIEAAVGPAVVRGDSGSMAQVVQNLLVNARLYAPGTPVRLHAERLGNRIILHVSDGGRGVPEDEKATVFARGARGRSSRGTSGSGLGLYVASRLMAEMGGSLYLAEGSGGAHFVVELPAGDTEPSRVATSRPERPPAEVTPRRSDPALK